MRNLFSKLLLLLLVFSGVSLAAPSANQVYLLNNKMGSIAQKVQLGTLLNDAYTNPSELDLDNGTVMIGNVSDQGSAVTLTSTQILVGSGTNIATPRTVTGDVTIGNTGVTAIGASKILTTMVADSNVTLAKLADPVMKETLVTLSQANITGMSVTPVALIAAPGAGKVIIVDEIEFFHDYATAVYTSGGDVTIEYETSGVDVNVFDVALVTAGADDNWLVKGTTPYVSAAGTASHFSLTTSINKGIEITNASAPFGGGNASNIIKLRLRYHVVTVQT